MNEKNIRKLLIQPFYAINISPSLQGEHPTLIPKETWVKAQIKLIKEIGEQTYFEELLETLENPITTEDVENT